MTIARAKLICVFLLTLFLIVSCRENENQNGQAESSAQKANGENGGVNSTKDDVEELEKIIKLPIRPEEATWRFEDSNEKKLVAVLKFSAENAGQIVLQAEKIKPAAQSEIDAENWFPAELIAQSQLSGDETVKGTSYAVDNFLQPPFTGGKITRIADTNFFVLELTAA